MATCPKCKAQINDTASTCEYCGERVIPGDTLSSVPEKITNWQKIVIIVSIIILIAIALTFSGAEKRENQAAQNTFSNPVDAIVYNYAERTGLSSAFGKPEITMNAETKKAIVFVDFPAGPMSVNQAASFAMDVCRQLARTYVEKGYMPRALAVAVSSGGTQGTQVHYGAAVYNGNVDVLGWEPAGIAK